MGHVLYLRKGSVHTVPYVGLPAGYTQLKYIQSTGTQYINSEVTPNIATKIELDFNIISVGPDDTICGTISPNMVIGYSQTAISGAFKSGTGFNVSVTTDVIGRHYASIRNGIFALDGTDNSFTGVETYSTSQKIYLFASSYTGASDGAYGKVAAKLYSCKIYDNGTLVRDYLPCISPSGAVGLYDLVGRQFYGNAGTGVFFAGPREELALPDGYTELEYIKATGTQYINTGFAPNQNTRVVCDAVFAAQSAAAWLFGARHGNTDRTYNFLTYSNYYRSDYNASTDEQITETQTGRYVVDKNKNVTKINGTAAKTATAGEFTCTHNLFLLANNNNGTAAGQCSATLYSCQIYDNGTLIRDYWPCRNASGVAGLYDFVGQQFYANAGTGTFLDDLIETVAITASNIGTYFTVTNGTYKFNGSGSVFTSNNGGVNSSTASTVLTAKQDIMALTFNYSYSSEANYDKFTLKVGGTTVENAVSGATTSKSYSGSLSSGQKIEFTYAKDSSQHKNDDKCTFSNMYITIAKGV